MIVSFSLKNQIIRRMDSNTVVAQSKNYLRAKFNALTGDWIGPITAIFNEYTVILDDNNECVVPWEVLQKPGIVKVSAFCGDLHTASVATMEVNPSGYIDGQTPEPPTPDVYAQLTGLVKNAVDTANSVQQRADAGEFDGQDGKNGADGYSPVATVQQTADGATITVTDKTGTSTATVKNGEPGPQGEPGPAGQQGPQGPAGLDAPQIDDTQASPDNPWSGAKVATELGKYAPLESALTISGIGSDIASLSPTIAWKMQGLKLFGRTTQDGTPAPETPIPLVSAGDSGSVDITVSGGEQSQSMKFATPNGLPGIPVNSGGNFTDETGQQWICDEIDFSRGMYIQRIGYISTENMRFYVAESDGYPAGESLFFKSVVSNEGAIPCKDGLCSKLPFKTAALNNDIDGFYFLGAGVYCRIQGVSDLEQFKSLISGAEFLYVLPSTVETALSPEELETYAALTSYNGTTNVIAQGCGISATALANPNAYISGLIQRISALESAATNI